jgi:hypothetical protein
VWSTAVSLPEKVPWNALDRYIRAVNIPIYGVLYRTKIPFLFLVRWAGKMDSQKVMALWKEATS